MSRSRVLAGHHKRQTDLALHAAYRRLSCQPAARACFDALLEAVRCRGRGLLAPAAVFAANAAPRHPGVTALVNFALHHAQHLRALDDWPGCAGPWRMVEASLAHHLLARWPVPGFLAAAWHAEGGADGADVADDADSVHGGVDGVDAWAQAKRSWYIEHAAGTSLRSLHGLPFTLTRAMERTLLATRPHVDIAVALRRAELRGLGAAASLVDAVLASRPAMELRHGDFWRRVWMFFVAHDVRCDEVGPMIDFIHAVRHGTGGEGAPPPPWPAFSIEGRTPASLRRLMAKWHRSLAVGDIGLSWQPSGLRPWSVQDAHDDPALPPVVWTLHELTNSAQLRAEGKVLQHCVASYGAACLRGRSRIWSLARQRGATCRPVLTIEIHPSTRLVVQARGFRNQWPRGRPLEILRAWAARERLTLRL